jgi:hypothetical protein
LPAFFVLFKRKIREIVQGVCRVLLELSHLEPTVETYVFL